MYFGTINTYLSKQPLVLVLSKFSVNIYKIPVCIIISACRFKLQNCYFSIIIINRVYYCVTLPLFPYYCFDKFRQRQQGIFHIQ